MGIFSFGGSSSSGSDNSNSLIDETVDSIKTGTANTNTKGNTNTNTSGTSTGTSTGTTNQNTVNSGSVNTGKNTTTNSGSVNTGKNTTTNSGSVNTVDVAANNSVTYNSGHVDTSQVMLSNDALNYLVKGALESNQGLASVSSGQKAAGGYNSTSTSLLTNDLLANIAGEVAVRGAKTVNTVGASTSSTFNSAQKTTQKIGGSTSVSDVMNNIGASTSISDSINNIGGSTSSSTGTITNNNTSTNNSNSNSTQDSTSNTASTENVNANKTGTSQSSSNKNNQSKEAKGGWIICTELAAQGKLNLKFYLCGLAVFNSYKDEYKKGYYIWGIPVVKHIRKYPDGLMTKAWVKISNARIEYLASLGGNKRAKKSVFGFFATHTLYWTCVILSKTLARNFKLTSPD